MPCQSLCHFVFIKFAILFCLLFFYADERNAAQDKHFQEKKFWCACSLCLWMCFDYVVVVSGNLSLCEWICRGLRSFQTSCSLTASHILTWWTAVWMSALRSFYQKSISKKWTECFMEKIWSESLPVFRTVRLMTRFQAHHLPWKCSSNCWKAWFRAEGLCFRCWSRTRTTCSQGQNRSRTERDCPVDQ